MNNFYSKCISFRYKFESKNNSPEKKPMLSNKFTELYIKQVNPLSGSVLFVGQSSCPSENPPCLT